jgi:BTB/POZ domain
MERVTLNVGGKHFTTTLATLRSFGNETMLGELSTKEDICTEVVFLDRDPTLFLHILNCMRNRRVFSAQQLGVSPTIWGLELAYYGLREDNGDDDEKNKKRPRPIDVVNELEKKKTTSMEIQREKIESVLLWMLSLYPKQNKFSFLNFDRSLHAKPEDMPESVFRMDAEYIKLYEKEWKAICIENKVHFKVTYGTGNVTAAGPPAKRITSIVFPARFTFAEIRITCFGDT